MDSEFGDLQKKQIWSIITQLFVLKGKRIVKSMCEFNIKRFIDGTTRKSKEIFFGRCNIQVVAVDKFDTYVPVAQWLTV